MKKLFALSLLIISLLNVLSAQQPCQQEKADSMPLKWTEEKHQYSSANTKGLTAAKVTAVLKSMDRYYNVTKDFYTGIKGNKVVWYKNFYPDEVIKYPGTAQEIKFFTNKFVCGKDKLYDDIITERFVLFVYANSLDALIKNTGQMHNNKLDSYKGKTIYRISYRLGTHKDYSYFEPPASSGFSAGWGLQHFRLVLITYPGKLPFRYLTRAELIDFLRQQTNEYEKIETDRLKLVYPVRPKEVQEQEKNQMVEKLKKEYPNTPRRVQRYLEDYKTDEQKFNEAAKNTLEAFNKKRKRLDELEKKYEGRLDETGTTLAAYLFYDLIDDKWDFVPDKLTDDHLCDENGICRHGNAWVMFNEDYFNKKLPPEVPQFFTVSLGWRTNSFRQYYLDMRDDWLKRFDFKKLEAMLGK